ncbi:hypothetical protein TSUD_282750 [Trifolium subterraneum]|uniref:Reverse transcriptase zinc-binding domain-containing protein n=1 Tax=Trifolium subterraneum TaxID=3900 RepID=A0A2Z6NYG1_TRISU|nr:hypothetical protein TSUD_282750 [Trifolium subterraneum]
MPVIVWKKIVQIQRNFLWGGPKSSRKIAWVSWGKVCKSKREGGLGVRDLRAVNLALLGKWRWRLISGGVGFWRDVILARYGSLSPSPHIGGRLDGLRRASCWWRNVSLLGDPEDAISDWFSEGVTKKVGNGHLTSFWFDPWLGGVPLRTQFQRLFQASDQSASTVGEMSSWVEDDSWFWKHDPTGQYSVKSAFLALSRATTDDMIFSVEEERIGCRLIKIYCSGALLEMLVLLRVCYVV